MTAAGRESAPRKPPPGSRSTPNLTDTSACLRLSRKARPIARLRERIGGISQKMLTQTLRQLERDGLVLRRVHPVIPPHVDYRLTPLGQSLGEAVCGIWTWVEKHLKDVERSRRAYELRAPAGSAADGASQRPSRR